MNIGEASGASVAATDCTNAVLEAADELSNEGCVFTETLPVLPSINDPDVVSVMEPDIDEDPSSSTLPKNVCSPVHVGDIDVFRAGALAESIAVPADPLIGVSPTSAVGAPSDSGDCCNCTFPALSITSAVRLPCGSVIEAPPLEPNPIENAPLALLKIVPSQPIPGGTTYNNDAVSGPVNMMLGGWYWARVNVITPAATPVTSMVVLPPKQVSAAPMTWAFSGPLQESLCDPAAIWIKLLLTVKLSATRYPFFPVQHCATV